MEYYRILTAINVKEPVWSLLWCLPTSKEQGLRDLEHLKKAEQNPLVIYKLVKIEDIL